MLPARSTLSPDAALTVAAVARRLGVAPATLRTWDRRYGMGPSERSAGSHRRYSATDLIRLTAMARLVLAGVSPSEAAAQALALSVKGAKAGLEKICRQAENQSDLVALLYKYAMKCDQKKIEELVSKSISEIGVEATWVEVLAPLLYEIGEEWARTGAGIEVEHLVSEVLRKILSRNFREISKPKNSRPVLLACVGDEVHTLALTALAAVLAEEDVECIFLGARTPQIAVNEIVSKAAPPAIFLWAQLSKNADFGFIKAIPAIRPAPRILLGGPGWNFAKLKPDNKVTVTKGLADARDQILQALAI